MIPFPYTSLYKCTKKALDNGVNHYRGLWENLGLTRSMFYMKRSALDFRLFISTIFSAIVTPEQTM